MKRGRFTYSFIACPAIMEGTWSEAGDVPNNTVSTDLLVDSRQNAMCSSLQPSRWQHNRLIGSIDTRRGKLLPSGTCAGDQMSSSKGILPPIWFLFILLSEYVLHTEARHAVFVYPASAL